MREAVYLTLVHHPTLDREGKRVATAVTTLDLHDFARLARTYGLGGVYATTPLAGQRELVSKLLHHWISGHGGRVNPCRRQALEVLRVAEDLARVVSEVADHWGRPPQLIATSARPSPERVSFGEARRLLEEGNGPVILLFGTGWGLAPEVLEACPWTLEPIRGAGDYNHLSVRAAAAIVVDRLFG